MCCFELEATLRVRFDFVLRELELELPNKEDFPKA